MYCFVYICLQRSCLVSFDTHHAHWLCFLKLLRNSEIYDSVTSKSDKMSTARQPQKKRQPTPRSRKESHKYSVYNGE
jgi:hypothetical protein